MLLLYDLDNVPDNLYDQDNVPVHLYDMANVPDSLYDMDNVPKAEGLRCVVGEYCKGMAKLGWENAKKYRDSAKDQTMERLNSQPKEV